MVKEHILSIKKNKSMLAMALVIVFVILARIFVFGSYIVPTKSMENTIMTSDCLIGYKLAYANNKPEHGDIITFNEEGRILVKRVIALPGETVDIKDGSVFVDGNKLDENYTVGKTEQLNNNVVFPHKLGEDEVWVMGDNRGNSSDSRVFGPIKLNQIESKIVLRYFPFNKIGSV